MAVHFIAMCLRGYISAAASLYSEEFSRAVNQKMLVYQRHYSSLFYGACVVCGSIRTPSLKSGLLFRSALNAKSATVNAVAFDTFLWVCREPAVDHLTGAF